VVVAVGNVLPLRDHIHVKRLDASPFGAFAAIVVKHMASRYRAIEDNIGDTVRCAKNFVHSDTTVAVTTLAAYP
jgi:hypothetical protein